MRTNKLFKLLKAIIPIVMAMVSLTAFSGCSSDEDVPVVPKPKAPTWNKNDLKAIFAIYKKCGPWLNEWDFNDSSTWLGISYALDLDSNQYRVVEFDVPEGDFKGDFPDEFTDLTELRVLRIGGSMTGQIPDSISKLKNLEKLYIWGTNMNTTIPESIGELTNLKALSIKGNPGVHGPLPNSIGNLTNLEYINVMENNLSGELPKSMKNLKKLYYCVLVRNHFSGTFPLEIAQNSPVAYMCSENDIENLPFEIWSDSIKCAMPDLQYNKLHGTLPGWVFKTEEWKNFHGFVSNQKEGYGYSNYVE